MRGIHFALSMSIKLGSDIQPGEFVPVVMIDRPTWGRTVMTDWNDAKENSTSWRDIRKRISAMTGTDASADDWYKHAIQYHLLTSDTLHSHKRNIKHMVIYIGKPINGNTFGGQYEMIIWNSGMCNYQTYGKPSGLPGSYRKSSPKASYNTTYLPKYTRIPIDDPNDTTYDPAGWNPLFYHACGDYFHGMTAVGERTSWKSSNDYRAQTYRSCSGHSVAAYGPGIMDFSPQNLRHTDLFSDLSYRTPGYGGWTYKRYTRYYAVHEPGGWGLDANGYYMTFLTVPGKVNGIANINKHVYSDKYYVPDQLGQEHDQQSITYFPQRTVQYELIGTGSETINTSGNWKDVDFIIDRNLSTSSSAFALGSNNELQIKTKQAPSKIHAALNSDTVVKQVEIELRQIRKKFMNPGLRLVYSLWNYRDPDNPVQVTEQTEVRPESVGTKDSRLIFAVDLAGDHITYDDLNNCRLRIWVDG